MAAALLTKDVALAEGYSEKLLKLNVGGKTNPTALIANRPSLDEGPELNNTLRDKKDVCVNVILRLRLRKAGPPNIKRAGAMVRPFAPLTLARSPMLGVYVRLTSRCARAD